MKLLLVLSSDTLYNLISVYVKPLGFELIRYNYIQKAMDNIEEIDPAAIIISTSNFPRQWKTMAQFIRCERSKDACPIILIKGDTFNSEEAMKASHLGISGIINEDLGNPAEIERLQGILGRYLSINEKRKSRRIHTESWQNIGFIFSRPKDKVLISGNVKDISLEGFSFQAEYPSLMEEIQLNTLLKECSFRAGASILSPVCRLARTGKIVSMEFVSFPSGEKELLTNYLEKLPLLELNAKVLDAT